MSALIGTRWTPHTIVRRDTERGFFESINPSFEREDLQVQHALLAKPAPRRVPWQVWWVLIAAVAGCLAWRFA